MPDTEERVLLNAVVRRCPTRYLCALLVNLFPEKQDAVYWQWNDYEKRRTWRFCLSFCWMTALESKNLTFSSHRLRRCREAWQHCYDSAKIISRKPAARLCRQQWWHQWSKLHLSIMTRSWTILRTLQAIVKEPSAIETYCVFRGTKHCTARIKKLKIINASNQDRMPCSLRNQLFRSVRSKECRPESIWLEWVPDQGGPVQNN